LSLWAIAVEEARALTICEDDAVLSRHFVPCAEAALASLPDDWDIVLWGWNFDSYLGFDMMPGVSPCLASFDQDAMRAGIEQFQNEVPAPRLYRLLRAFGTPCYTVSPKGAALLRQHCLPLRAMSVYFPGLERTLENGGLDTMMNDAYPRLSAFVCFPPLAITPNRHDISTIQPRD
jgi:GR25 family glycosyltransferase involved in LPS biosynthesis